MSNKPSGSGGQMDVDDCGKYIEAEKLIKMLDAILTAFGLETGIGLFDSPIQDGTNKRAINIDLSNDIAGVFMTCFTILRKKANPDIDTTDRGVDQTAQILGMEKPIPDIMAKIVELNLGIDFEEATPLMNMITAFKCSFDEVRAGVTKFMIKADNARGTKRTAAGTTKKARHDPQRWSNISSYSLNNQHAPLLQGITYAPIRRTGLVNSMGPITQAVLLANEKKNPNKLADALLNSINMLPMRSEIVLAIKDARSPGAIGSMMKELGDLLLLTTARSTQKIYLPILLFKYIMDNRTEEMPLNFSGKNLMALIEIAFAEGKLYWAIKCNEQYGVAAQVIFHAMFGTYLDDLSILPQITKTPNWEKRKQMNKFFQKRHASSVALVNPVRMTMFAQMAQSLPTKILGNIAPCMTSRSSFSGRRERNFSQEFLLYLKTGKCTVSYSSDPNSLAYALRNMKEEIILGKYSTLKAGTGSWFGLVKNAKGGYEFIEDAKFTPTKTGQYFYSDS